MEILLFTLIRMDSEHVAIHHWKMS